MFVFVFVGLAVTCWAEQCEVTNVCGTAVFPGLDVVDSQLVAQDTADVQRLSRFV